MKALSLQDVLEQLGVARKTVLLLVARGKLAAFKVGRQWRFEQQDVDAFIAAQKAAAVKRATSAPAIATTAVRPSASGVNWKGSDRYTH
jgi:excisionase family DNA binding protein